MFIYIYILCDYNHKRIWVWWRPRTRWEGLLSWGHWGVIDTQQNGNLVLAPRHLFGNEAPEVALEKANWVDGEAKRPLPSLLGWFCSVKW